MSDAAAETVIDPVSVVVVAPTVVVVVVASTDWDELLQAEAATDRVASAPSRRGASDAESGVGTGSYWCYLHHDVGGLHHCGGEVSLFEPEIIRRLASEE